ncbi:MAG: hypothetical protein ACTSWN_06250 [Promethearchaeota archaeon]
MKKIFGDHLPIRDRRDLINTLFEGPANKRLLPFMQKQERDSISFH